MPLHRLSPRFSDHEGVYQLTLNSHKSSQTYSENGVEKGVRSGIYQSKHAAEVHCANIIVCVGPCVHRVQRQSGNSFDSKCNIDLKRTVFSVREWREEVSWKFVFCPMDFREATETKCCLGQRKGPYRLHKSCSLAQVGELAAAVNEEALLLDDERGINSDEQVRGKFCRKAVMSKKYAYT